MLDLDKVKIDQNDYLQMIVDRDISIALLQKQLRTVIDECNRLMEKYEPKPEVKTVPGIVEAE